MTVSEVASRLQLHPEVVRRWLRQGRLAGRKWGRAWHIEATSLPEVPRANSGEPPNIFDATVQQTSARTGVATLGVGARQLQAVTTDIPRGSAVRVQLAADAILVAPSGIEGISARNQWPATVESIVETRSGLVVHFGPSPALAVSLTAQALRELKLRPGREVVLIFKATACHVSCTDVATSPTRERNP